MGTEKKAKLFRIALGYEGGEETPKSISGTRHRESLPYDVREATHHESLRGVSGHWDVLGAGQETDMGVKQTHKLGAIGGVKEELGTALGI